jgi:uncharacterized membrane protein YbhN (UPF0104 family)
MVRFRRWAAIAVALATIGYLAYAVWKGLSETAAELYAFDWPIYVPVLLLTLVNYGLRYFKWHYLLRQLGVHIPHSANAPIFITGLAMVISPAKAGEVVKPYLVREVTGAPMARTIPALVAERATDGIAVVALAALGVSTFYAEAESLIWGTVVGIAAVLAVLMVRPLAHGVIGLVGRLPPLSGLAARLLEAYEALRTCLAPVPLLVTVVASLIAWWAECVGYWLVLRGLGHATAGLDVSTFLYAFATVFGAPSPGGMGMADAALAEGATALVAGLSAPEALAASLLIRVATLWFGVALGAIALLRMEAVLAAHRTPVEEG